MMSQPENRAGTGRFRPGFSGNPGGRPKAVEEVKALARQHGPEAVAGIARLMREAKSEAVQLAAAIAMLDRAYGKPAQELQHTGKEGEEPIVVETPFADPIVREHARAMYDRLTEMGIRN